MGAYGGTPHSWMVDRTWMIWGYPYIRKPPNMQYIYFTYGKGMLQARRKWCNYVELHNFRTRVTTRSEQQATRF